MDVSELSVMPSTKEANLVWGYFRRVDKPVLNICPPTSNVTIALSIKSGEIRVRLEWRPDNKCDAFGLNVAVVVEVVYGDKLGLVELLCCWGEIVVDVVVEELVVDGDTITDGGTILFFGGCCKCMAVRRLSV